MKKEFIFSEDEKSVTIVQNNKEKSYHIGDVIEVNWNKETVYEEEDFKEAIYNKKYWQIVDFNKNNNQAFVFSNIDMYGEAYPYFIQININSIKKIISRLIPVSLNYVYNHHNGSCCIYEGEIIYLDKYKCDKENNIISFFKCDSNGIDQEDCPHINFTKDEFKYSYDLDTVAIERLNKIIENTKAEIVLSSSWRLFELSDIVSSLKSKGFKYDIKYITTKKDMERGLQILKFIKENNVKDYIVIDDDSFDIENYFSKEQFVHTRWKTGLLDEHVDYIIKYFNK